MIPRACKRLAEVDFPIAAVSKHAVREKSIRHGHPSTLHLWWARRPLASSRAVLLALLLPDPCDERCPETFKDQARKLLPPVVGKVGPGDDDLRAKLLTFIGHFANWDLAADPAWTDAGRALVKAAHGEEPPLAVDPFAGGGSIPLEALRLGCEAFASDLNPVACLILKVMLEDIPRHGPKLADDLRAAGAEIKRQAERELADLYPKDPDGAAPVAYLWARTVRCEAPNCGAEIPLMRSFWLCNKPKRKRALRHRVERPEGAPPRVAFEVFEPKTEGQVRGGTVTRAKATCLCCGAVLPPERVRTQLAAQRGGADVVFDERGERIGGGRMTTVVTLRPEERRGGRRYRLPNDADYAAVRRAQERLADILDAWERGGKQGLRPVPDEPLPLMSGTFNVPLYGINTWGDLFTARQKITLVTLGRHIRLADVSGVLRELLACALSVFARACNGNARLRPDSSVAPAFGMQALPITWTFPETIVSGGRSEHFDGALSNVAQIVEQFPLLSTGQVQSADATDHPLPDRSAAVWFTDPPYYFAIPYADLSDFFFVWLKRILPEHALLHDSRFSEDSLTPKGPEICEMARWDSDRYPHKDKQFFEHGMTAAFAEGHRVLREDGVGCVVFAHKTTEGWEALLSGLIRGGWTVTGSWPIATEMASRLRARDSAALATSVHLVCRPRPEDAPVGDWADVLRELRGRVADWMERLQGEGVRGADLVFACVGPALEIFSRCRSVETAEGREVNLAEYLEKVWEVVSRTALETILGAADAQAGNGMAGALEEDARLTALFLWTLQSTEMSGEDDEANEDQAVAKAAARGFSLPFDMVRRFAQPMGIDLDHWTGHIIGLEKGVVRLIPVAERAKALFGEDGAGAAADRIEREPGSNPQMMLFPDIEAAPKPGTRRAGRKRIFDGDAELRSLDATTLDRVHAAMLLQAGGRATALRTLIDAERERGPEFERLANALSALYPRVSREKRLLDAMLLAAPK